jgi:hypothetical protein
VSNLPPIKVQASSGDREALSGDREALSGDREALSGDREALSGGGEVPDSLGRSPMRLMGHRSTARRPRIFSRFLERHLSRAIS